MAPSRSNSSSTNRGRGGRGRDRSGRGRGRGSWRGGSTSSRSSRASSRGVSLRSTAIPAPDPSGIHEFTHAGSSARSRAPSQTPAPSSRSRRESIASRSGRGGTNDAATVVGDEAERDEDFDALNEVVMAVDMRNNGTVGCAYYVAREEVLYLMPDAQLGGKAMVDMLKLHVEPTVIVIASRLDDDVIDQLDPEIRHRGSSVEEDVNQFVLPFILEIRPPAEFNTEVAKHRIINLDLAADDGPRLDFMTPGDVYGAGLEHDHGEAIGHQEKLLRFAGYIDLDNGSSIGCAGAVISYLQRRRAAGSLPGDQDAHNFFRISHLQMSTLANSMFINADTLHSLQIIETESHPNSQNQGPRSSGAKEGLSVYGVFHRLARTSQGRQRLRQWFLRPTINMSTIQQRQRSISIFVRSDNVVPVQELTKNLKGMGHIRSQILKLRKGVTLNLPINSASTKSIWSTIRSFVFHALKVRDLIQEVNGAEDLEVRNNILEKFESYHLAQIGRQISDVIDFEQTVAQHRSVIKSGIDDELDRMQRSYHGLDALLTEVSKVLADQIPRGASTLNIIYFPQLGFLISCIDDVDPESGAFTGDDIAGWDRAFTDGGVAYYKSPEMTEMDQKFGDLYSMICDKEIEILHDLAKSILQYDDILIAVSELAGDLDCLLALAQGAKNYQLVSPGITKDNIIDITGGRHILQEMTVPAFIANDTLLIGGNGGIHNDTRAHSILSEDVPSRATSVPARTAAISEVPQDGPSVLIMTGPNYSGKSVYLKQVALIVYMAHVGSFVPAEAATIGVTDKILTRISTRESVSRIQSAFMIDLQQVSLALNLATPRSLLVLDEVGKGTDSKDGAGLACGVLEHLLSLGDVCPKVVAATHFHEIFDNGFLQSSVQLMFANMEVRIEPKARVENQITYLYNLRLGRSVASFGTLCAALNGIAPEIIKRAEQLILLESLGEDLIAACAILPESEIAELQEAETIARNFLAMDITDDPRKLLEDCLRVPTTTASPSYREEAVLSTTESMLFT